MRRSIERPRKEGAVRFGLVIALIGDAMVLPGPIPPGLEGSTGALLIAIGVIEWRRRRNVDPSLTRVDVHTSSARDTSEK